mmetsp:Transcript_129216/g.258010  ORF Transcript_129216/g.258010 Transcript_129216/m.258010 type:complete len:441 (+) Transcript_129216:86-1408(+)
MAEVAEVGTVFFASLLDKRLAPLGNTFVHGDRDSYAQLIRDACGTARRRSSSYAGYVPFARDHDVQEQTTPSCPFEHYCSEAAAPPPAEPVRPLPPCSAMLDEPSRHFDAPQLVPLGLWSNTNSEFEDDGNDFDTVYQPVQPVQHGYGMPGLAALTLTSPPALLIMGPHLGSTTPNGSVISLSDATESAQQDPQWSSETNMPTQVPVFNAPEPEQPLHVEAPCSASAAPEPITTLMIRNLPRSLTQVQLIAELDRCGLANLYDFAYMPRCFQSGENNGFAFVNFISPAAAGRLVGAWHRQRLFGIGPSDAALNLSPAVLQGFEANVAKWDVPRSRRIRNPDYVPFVAGDRQVGRPRTHAPRPPADMPKPNGQSGTSTTPAAQKPRANGWRSAMTAGASSRGQQHQQQSQKQQPMPVRTTPAGLPAPAQLSRAWKRANRAK